MRRKGERKMGPDTSDSQCWYLPTNRVLHSQWYRNQALHIITITSARSVTAQEPPGTPDTVHSWYSVHVFSLTFLTLARLLEKINRYITIPCQEKNPDKKYKK